MPKSMQDRPRGPRKPYAKPAHAAPSSSARPAFRRPRSDDNDHHGRPARPIHSAKPKPQSGPVKAQPAQLDLSGKPLAAVPSTSELAGVGKINLSNCSLDTISFTKHAAASLTWLNVSGNKLAEAAAWQGIEQLQTLFVLNASHCELTKVPACVAALSKLKALVLSHNSLTSLEHVANLPDLNTIVVSNNALTALPSSLATLPSLKKISAAHNRLTSATLPDLSSLAHLHELRLNDNPTLTSLPPHFGSWGKANGAPGLEILDLGNCGFESWFGLRELAKQSAVVNLGLKGNKVAEDAVRETGPGEFRAKLTILLPSLRILDTHRFDAKHADLKTRRAQRTDEQRILDAGPMALAANAKSEAPVSVDEMLHARERERENRRRRKKGITEELGEGRAKKRTRTDEEQDDAVSAERDGDAAATLAGSEEDKAGPAAAAEERKKPKKRKSRAEKRAAKEASETAANGAESEPAAKASHASPSLETRDTSPTAEAQMSKPKTDKKQKVKKGGVLAALQADDDDDVEASAASSSLRGAKAGPSSAPVAKPASGPEPAPRKEEKQKTSVAKIIEVRRPDSAAKGGKKRSGASAAAKEQEAGAAGPTSRKVDVGELLGLTKPAAQETPSAQAEGEAADRPTAFAGLSGGSGLFGSGGWD